MIEIFDIQNNVVVMQTTTWEGADRWLKIKGAIRPEGVEDIGSITHVVYAVGDEAGLSSYILPEVIQ